MNKKMMKSHTEDDDQAAPLLSYQSESALLKQHVHIYRHKTDDEGQIFSFSSGCGLFSLKRTGFYSQGILVN